MLVLLQLMIMPEALLVENYRTISGLCRQTGWAPACKPKRILEDIYTWIKENEKVIREII